MSELRRDTALGPSTGMGANSSGADDASVAVRADPSLARLARRRRLAPRSLVRRSPVGTAAALFLLFGLLVALFGPLLGTGDPERLDPLATFAAPSKSYPMGADFLGRSILARLVVGLRISLMLAALSALLAAGLGAFLGLVAGYFGGKLDELIMRLVDFVFAFPTLLLALLVVLVSGPGIRGVIVTIVIATIPIFSRVARAPTLSVRRTEYTIAARVLGASPARVLFRHVLPNVSTPLLVQLTFTLSGALIAEGALSFLGLGVQPPQPSLGSLLRDGKTYMELASWTMLFPAITLSALILAVNLLGDELQTLTDPRLRGR
ncbi:MAG: peptide/nickel transport system permease protein [Thermomicrobiales bacterium]|nr:peptide/nickel transport system permease protein [Thermomicrobiales bacterium]